MNKPLPLVIITGASSGIGAATAKNLATTEPDRTKAMHQRLQQWQQDTAAFIPKPKP